MCKQELKDPEGLVQTVALGAMEEQEEPFNQHVRVKSATERQVEMVVQVAPEEKEETVLRESVKVFIGLQETPF